MRLGRRAGARLGIADGRARRALRADVPRSGQGPARALPARPAAGSRPLAQAAGARHRDPACASTTTSSTRCRRRPTGSCATSRATRRDRVAARRRRARDRLFVDDRRLRQHRPADALLHLRPRGLSRRDPRLLRRLRDDGAGPVAGRPPTRSPRRWATSTAYVRSMQPATTRSWPGSASSTTAALRRASSTGCSAGRAAQVVPARRVCPDRAGRRQARATREGAPPRARARAALDIDVVTRRPARPDRGQTICSSSMSWRSRRGAETDEVERARIEHASPPVRACRRAGRSAGRWRAIAEHLVDVTSPHVRSRLASSTVRRQDVVEDDHARTATAAPPR